MVGEAPARSLRTTLLLSMTGSTGLFTRYTALKSLSCQLVMYRSSLGLRTNCFLALDG